MNWIYLRHCAWVDTRARFVAGTPRGGALLDLGSSDGQTLGHIAELRPDLRLFAADVAGAPEKYPPGSVFHRADLERDALPWPAGSMDAVTCMHVIEHLRDQSVLLREAARLLKPGGQIYFETPHPKSLTLASPPGRAAGAFTLNFFDDLTHVQLVTMGALAQRVRGVGLEVTDSGTSRNWLFAAAYPLFLFRGASSRKFTAWVHWLGWSAYLIARRPAQSG
jgi:SAM-dependent methyltransferase